MRQLRSVPLHPQDTLEVSRSPGIAVNPVGVVNVNVMSDHPADHLQRAVGRKFRNPDRIGLSGKEDHPDQMRSLRSLGRTQTAPRTRTSSSSTLNLDADLFRLCSVRH